MNKDWHKKSLRHFCLQLSKAQLSTSSTMCSSIISMPALLVPVIGIACTASL